MASLATGSVNRGGSFKRAHKSNSIGGESGRRRAKNPNIDADGNSGGSDESGGGVELTSEEAKAKAKSDALSHWQTAQAMARPKMDISKALAIMGFSSSRYVQRTRRIY